MQGFGSCLGYRTKEGKGKMAQALVVSILRGNPLLDCKAGGINLHESPLVISLDWQSAADGTVSLGICSTYRAQSADGRSAPQPVKIRGNIRRIDTIPDTGGTAPTGGYTVSFLNSSLVDPVGLAPNGRSGTVVQMWKPENPPFVDEDMTLTIAGAGDTNGGTIVLYLEP
jgi:hypothetical protein